MKNTPVSQHGAYDYAERIRARLPGQLAKVRQAAGLSRYRLAKNCKVTAETIGQIEQGETNPSMCIVAQICFGLGMTFAEFVALLEPGR